VAEKGKRVVRGKLDIQITNFIMQVVFPLGYNLKTSTHSSQHFYFSIVNGINITATQAASPSFLQNIEEPRLS
jgi:hypothetical protein